MKSLATSLIVLVIGAGLAEGRSSSSALIGDIYNLGRVTKMYHDSEGVYPQSWRELEGRFGPTDKFCSVLDPHDRFTFVSSPVFLPARPTEERILLISRDTFRPPTERQVPILGTWYKSLGKEVYVAAVQRGDSVFVRRLSHDHAAQFFREAGADLPQPSGLGLYPHERAHWLRVIAWWLGGGLIGAYVIWRIARAKRETANKATLAIA